MATKRRSLLVWVILISLAGCSQKERQPPATNLPAAVATSVPQQVHMKSSRTIAMKDAIAIYGEIWLLPVAKEITPEQREVAAFATQLLGDYELARIHVDEKRVLEFYYFAKAQGLDSPNYLFVYQVSSREIIIRAVSNPWS